MNVEIMFKIMLIVLRAVFGFVVILLVNSSLVSPLSSRPKTKATVAFGFLDKKSWQSEAHSFGVMRGFGRWRVRADAMIIKACVDSAVFMVSMMTALSRMDVPPAALA